ncbi:MAG: hypothetical protein WCF67_04035 [Chitinophagaceae bacterium]
MKVVVVVKLTRSVNSSLLIISRTMMRTLFALFLLVITKDIRSQDPKAEKFCQYLDQPIQKLLVNLKTTVVDKRIGRTTTGSVRNLFLVLADSSYFEIFPVFNQTSRTEQFNMKNYPTYKIKCLFFHAHGEMVKPCGCMNFPPSAELPDEQMR